MTTKHRRSPQRSRTRTLDAGAFSAWLTEFRQALKTGRDTHVDCQDCNACCSSRYFIHVRPTDKKALATIPKRLLVTAPQMPKGHKLLGYDNHGLCPLWHDGGCTIYAARPRTCRVFDCRAFAATGLPAGGADQARITAQAKRWRFSYPTAQDRVLHRAVKAAARFLVKHAGDFPEGRAPSDAHQLTRAAIQTYALFLNDDGSLVRATSKQARQALARQVVDTCRMLDAGERA